MPKEFEHQFYDFDKKEIISKMKEMKGHFYLEFKY
jgi:hypothetical protein